MADCSGKYFHFKKFPNIDRNDGIEIKAFLDAASNLVDFISLLGVVFTPVQNDISQNIRTLNLASSSKSVRINSLGDLVDFYKKLKSREAEKTLSALLWLNRALEYVCYFLKLFIEDHEGGTKSNDLSPLFQQAYEKTLQQHHNRLIQGIFNVCLRAVPNRNSLFGPLMGKDDDIVTHEHREEQFVKEVKDYHYHLDRNTAHISALVGK